MDRLIIQEELEARILHGLSCEWERALWILEPSYRKMRPPFFALRGMADRWAFWDGEKREMAFSRSLVLNHSWGSVREVLRHEMAHQLAEEVLGGRGSSPHGPTFQKACLLLRATPRASGTYPTLDARLSRDSSREEDRILLRVRKLMALAGSPNRHEAEAAMTKAHELIARYNLDLLARAGRSDFITAPAGLPTLRHFAEDYSLAHLLQDFYFIQGIWLSSYVVEKGKMGRVLEVSGTVPNVKLALYVYDFVARFIQKQWLEYNGGKRLNRYRRTDFSVGIIEGFRSRLESQRESLKSPASQALLKLQDPRLKEYMAYQYPHTVFFRSGRRRRDARVVQDGRRVGKKLVITRALTERPAGRGLLLR